MRVAVVCPPNRDKMTWVAEGFRQAAHEVRTPGDLDAVRRADVECDLVVFGHRGAGIGHPEIAALAPGRRAFWVQWVTDLMAVEPGVLLKDQPAMSEQVVREMGLMDLVLVKERGLLDQYRGLGANAEWFDQAFPSHIGACEHRAVPEWDALLWGVYNSSYRQRRHDVDVLLSEGFVVAWAVQPGSERVPPGCLPLGYCPPGELPALASRAAVTLGVDLRHDLLGYASDRLWLALGMGSCHLRRQTPACGAQAHGRRYYATYTDEDTLVAAVSTLRADMARREQYGKEARSWVLRSHTYKHRAQELIELVNRCRSRTREPAEPAVASAE